MNIIKKMKYKVGQKFMVEMCEGYHLSKVIRREIEICRIDECTGLIWIKGCKKNSAKLQENGKNPYDDVRSCRFGWRFD